MTSTPLRDRRRQATRRYWAKVILIVLTMIGVGYGAWFARWARPKGPIPVVVGH